MSIETRSGVERVACEKLLRLMRHATQEKVFGSVGVEVRYQNGKPGHVAEQSQSATKVDG